jgi:shikimate dehydrogenase
MPYCGFRVGWVTRVRSGGHKSSEGCYNRFGRLDSGCPGKIGARTRVRGWGIMKRLLLGLIGANIQKSLSPALHEDACDAAGVRGYYHLMDLDVLPGRRLKDLVAAARTTGFVGVNITYPCKEAVLPLLDEVSAEAEQIGAVNAVTIDRNGHTKGHNTDRIGFRRAFEETLGRGAIHDKTALLIGAGGAGRAVAFALFDLGVETLLIHDKDADRAGRLVAALLSAFGVGRCRLVSDAASALSEAAGFVNATPVGMLGIPGVPVAVKAIGSHQWVADVIYTPLETELIKIAGARGAVVMGGSGMCVHQAAETFRLFTGLSPDIKRMHRTFAAAAAIRADVVTEES